MEIKHAHVPKDIGGLIERKEIKVQGRILIKYLICY